MIHNVTIEKVAKHAGSITKLSDIKQSACYGILMVVADQ